jgi:hypothetical protein
MPTFSFSEGKESLGRLLQRAFSTVEELVEFADANGFGGERSTLRALAPGASAPKVARAIVEEAHAQGAQGRLLSAIAAAHPELSAEVIALQMALRPKNNAVPTEPQRTPSPQPGPVGPTRSDVTVPPRADTRDLSPPAVPPVRHKRDPALPSHLQVPGWRELRWEATASAPTGDVVKVTAAGGSDIGNSRPAPESPPAPSQPTIGHVEPQGVSRGGSVLDWGRRVLRSLALSEKDRPTSPFAQPGASLPTSSPHAVELWDATAGDNPDDTGASLKSGGRVGAARVEPQIVSLGFSTPDAPDAPILNTTLAADTHYILWLGIAPEYIEGSLAGAAPLVGLSEGDEIDVILFGFPDQIILDGARHGRVRISARGNRVTKLAWKKTPKELSSFTLCFAVKTPRRPGRFALRCHLYSRGLLLQSHLVSAEVTLTAVEQRHGLRRTVDYNLTSRLDVARLGAEPCCQHSLFINDDGHGTHSFRFVSSKQGVAEDVADAHLDGVALAKLVRYAREALRIVAWGKATPWTVNDLYQFTGGLNLARLTDAMILLAQRGANLWMELSAAFAFVGPEAMKLRERMRAPGRVQIALKDSPDAVIPVALIYDYPFDAGLTKVTLCEAATAAIVAGRPLAEEPCFLGDCPNYKKRSVVCPGGFWGFRHDLGLPLHLPRGEVAAVIPRGAGTRAFAPISTDPAFVLRDEHLAELQHLSPGWLEILRDRESCLARLDEPRQLVYFYCHGGVRPQTETPFLRVGPLESDDILAESLVDRGVTWPEPDRPLVFLNGCHTTAASPDAMFSMLTAFAAHCNAAGVIGTEITNFEPVAVEFGRSLVTQFLAGEQVGRAVRVARLEVLRHGNPLGLMYIPFALPSLQLR